MKLLAPGGSFSQIKAAVTNGADAVYIGVPGFNARRMIAGDDSIATLSDMANCITWAHERGIEIHAALNIVIKDGEMLRALQSVEILARYSVDALIVQDVGLTAEIHSRFPEISLHASTQMGINGVDALQVFADLGGRCVVLPRETSLETVLAMKKHMPAMEIETFVHGALCFAFSGQCYYSAFIGGRSGNRGLCGQPCRKVYEYDGSKGHMFSCKDLCLIDDLKTLHDAGIAYLKIEGRAKDAVYTAKVVRSYREALNGLPVTTNLDYVFNRGYTKGLLLHRNDTRNTAYITHKGVSIGTVADIAEDSVTITSTHTLQIGDGLFFPHINTGCTIETVVAAKGMYRITPVLPRLRTNDAVFKNRDAGQEIRAPLSDGSDIVRKDLHISPEKFDIKQKIVKPECESIFWIMINNRQKLEYAIRKGFTHFIATQMVESHDCADGVTVYTMSDFGTTDETFAQFGGVVAISMNDLGMARAADTIAVPFCTLNIVNSAHAALYEDGFFFSWESGIEEILKNRFRHKGIVYIDGPLRLMTTFHSISEGVYRDEHHVVTARKKGSSTVLYNGDRLLAADYIPRLWKKVGGMCYNGEYDNFDEFCIRVDLYRTIITKLNSNERIHDEKDALKSRATYTKGLFGEGVT